MPRGQLPKAYLRMDPDLDAKHPDNLAEFIRIMCAANRQPWRGRFRNRAVLEALVGKSATRRAIHRGDLIPAAEHSCGYCPEGEATPDTLYLDGWDTWQEGDLTVAERMRGYRSRRNGRRNAPVTSTVTPAVTQASLRRIPPSEASDNKASNDDDDARAGPDDLELLTEDLLAPGHATQRQLRAIRNFARAVGTNRALEVMRHWRGQLDVDDRFTAAFEQLAAEATEAKAGRRKPSRFDYLDVPA